MQQISRKVMEARYDPDYDPEAGLLEFRLTYEGPLLAHNEARDKADHKHQIRQKFHPQLKRLWETNRFLKQEWTSDKGKMPLNEHLAGMFSRSGYRFVPVVWEAASLLCGLDVLILRTGDPGGVVHGGDLDNRLKTLLDALRMPKSTDELGQYTTPGQDEDPFYVLLEDDRLISNFRVEADSILEVKPEQASTFARVVVTVHIKPVGNLRGSLRYL